MADYYRDLAGEYDWLYDDDALTDGFAITRPAVAGVLQRFGPGCAVLDAACGTGVDAAALARRGFHVRAADGSDAMVEAAAARFRREGLAVPVQQCLWADLPDTIDERFDVVLCTGNALVHAAGREAMVQALTGLRRMVRPRGHVVVHSRNWEKLHAERRIVQVANRVRTRGGRTCVMFYAWEVPDRLDQEHIAHIVFLFEDGDRIEPHEYRISLLPVTLGELRERLELAGLREVGTDFGETTDQYVVIAVAASASEVHVSGNRLRDPGEHDHFSGDAGKPRVPAPEPTALVLVHERVPVSLVGRAAKGGRYPAREQPRARLR